jgi:AbrB family looped-hinge helix DNA binding protein
MTETVILGESGRIVLPAAIRKELGLKPGERLTVVSELGEIRILSRKMALESIRAEVLKHTRPGASLAGELIRDRREEVRRDDEEYRRPVAQGNAREKRQARKSRRPAGKTHG